MFRIWKYLPTFVFCTFVTIAQEPHHSLLSNGDQSEVIYITQIIRPQIWAQECTCTNRYIKMGPIKTHVICLQEILQPIRQSLHGTLLRHCGHVSYIGMLIEVIAVLQVVNYFIEKV